ncbi:MAG: dehydrogenase E1 component subunit alpha/beta [Cytophagales bacterium]
MDFKLEEYSEAQLLHLYENLLKTRLFEEKMLTLLRQNLISKWFSGIGQEAISIGATLAVESHEYILPVHRNLGVFLARNIPVSKLFAQIEGDKNGFTKGRDRSFHFSDSESHIHGMISHLGTQLSVACGIALANVLEGKKEVCLAFTGEGATSEGEFHEALNLASVWDLPVIFIVENNGYGLSTPVHEQYKVKSFVEKADAYAIETLVVDGNNVLEMYECIKNCAAKIRQEPKPILIEAQTFRMRGHEEAANNKFVPEQLIEAWKQKDPLFNFQNVLIENNILNDAKINYYTTKFKLEIEHGVDKVLESRKTIVADSELELKDVFQNYEYIAHTSVEESKEMRMIDAIKNAQELALKKYSKLVCMGQDIAEFGGVFKATEGLVDIFGKDRIRNTPLCESAILGASVGLSLKGYKSMVEMQFADFVSNGFNQIVNNIAKLHYRTGRNANVVVRMPTGAGVGAGPFHSQSTEAWFYKVPGLKIVFPSSPYDAKGLLLEAFNDPNPVLFFEHKAMYRSVAEQVPEDYYTLPLGKAKILTEGQLCTIITYGMGVHWAKQLKEVEQLNLEIVDLISLAPIDYETIEKSVEKTGKVLLLTEDTLTGSIISDLAAWIGERMFNKLDAPVLRLGSLDTPVPFNKALEENFLPKAQLKSKVYELINY